MPRPLPSLACAAVIALRAADAGAACDAEAPHGYLDPLEVTSSGQPSRVSESPSTTFVITGDEVRRSGATSLPEILRRVPGLDVRAISAIDGQLGLRGFAYEITDRILVLVDGRTVYIDFFGGTAYELLPVSLVDIEQIEVVLGPGASVYGNKAMLGTVNIITRSADDYPRADARVDVGAAGDARVGARYGARTGSWRLRATGLARRLTLFDPRGRDPSAAAGGTVSAGYSPSVGNEASLELGAMAGDTYMIPTQAMLQRFEAVFAYARARGRLGLGGPGAPWGHLNLDAVWNAGDVRSDEFPAPADPLRATFHTPYARLHHELHRRFWDVPMNLRWGGEVRLNTLDSTVTSGEQDLWNLAAFASDEIQLGCWHLTAGLRVDRSTLTRFHASPRLSVVWSPAPGHQLRAAFNTGYNDAHLLHYFSDLDLPNPNDPALPGPHVAGNRDLVAERVLYGEVGWSGALTEYLRAFTTAFAYRLTDWISLDPDAPTAPASVPYRNNGEPIEVFGGEVGVEIAVRRALFAYASWALLGPHDVVVEPYLSDAHGSPLHKVTAGFRVQARSGAYLTADAQYFGESEIARLRGPEDPAAPEMYVVKELDDYVMLNARLGYAFRSGLELSAAVTNALDDHAEQFPGAEKPERRFSATLAYTR